jgi:DNA-binding GntR family transcriptional regulator
MASPKTRADVAAAAGAASTETFQSAIPELGGVGHRTAQQRVAETLRHAILGGVLEPGTPLILSELSQRLGVSRTPIREAMRELAAEDLVDFDSYRSAVVHTPTLEEAREIYELRLELDPVAVRKAIVQITAEELDRAEAIHKQMLETNDSGDWVELNREFHRILLDASRSPRLTRIIGSLRNSAALQVATSLKAESSQIEHANQDHAQIIAAFRDRDADRAVELTDRHLRTTLEIIERFEAGRAGGSP